MATAHLLHGDMLKTLSALPENSVDAVVTDCPYELTSITKRFGKSGAAPAQFGTDGAFARASRGFMGMCYHPDTDIMTQAGWVPVGDLKVGDIVATLDTDHETLEWQPLAELHSYPFDGDLVDITHRSAMQRITPNHNMVIAKTPGAPLTFCKPGLLPRQFHMSAQAQPFSGRHDAVEIASLRHYGAHGDEMRIETKHFDPAAFFRFLGLWLGDGYVVCRTDDHPANDFFGLNVKKPRKVEAIRQSLQDLGIRFTETPPSNVDGTTTFYCYDFALLGFLKELKGAYGKRIPTWLFDWDHSYLERLYQGLIDSNGHRMALSGQEQFFTVSRQLAEDMQRLCLQIGRSAAVRLRPAVPTVICGNLTLGCDCWVVCILQPGKRLYGENSRTSSNVVKTAPYVGSVYCAGVARHHTLYTRFEGRPVWSGNSWDGTGISFQPETWVEVLRVLKPGGHMLCFGGSRTVHRIACAIEDSGFELRDTIMWLYGCLDETTRVATAEGVKPHTDIRVGDLVLCYDVARAEYSYQPVQEVLTYDFDDVAYHLIGDCGTQFVTRNHRCITEHGGVEGFEFAEDLSQEHQASVPFLESLQELQSALSDFQEDPTGRAWSGHKTTLVRVVPVHHTGRVWCLRVPTGAFVAVRDGVAFPTGNSGFPKSHDISKAIDKHLGTNRTVTGTAKVRDIRNGHGRGQGDGIHAANRDGPVYMERELTAAGSPEAAQWQGFGSALKPAFEPIILARKPLEGTLAVNTLKWGVGGINIDACRVGTETRLNPAAANKAGGNSYNMSVTGMPDAEARPAIERWPANVLHDGSDEVEAAFAEYGESKGVRRTGKRTGRTQDNGYGMGEQDAVTMGYDDAGTPARFFGRFPANVMHDGSDEVLDAFAVYGERGACSPIIGDEPSVPAKGDVIYGFRNRVPATFYGDTGTAARFYYSAKASAADRDGSRHPTVKPQGLMRYLVKMITPPGGTVLDCFAGSGSTGVAALAEGFSTILCEREDEYVADIVRRIPQIKVLRPTTALAA
jgi:DNA modification methylase